MLKKTAIYLSLLIVALLSTSWGFFSHKTINRHAVFCLPPEMLGFYKKHIEYITEHAIDPDKISRINPLEAVRHYIDIENYGETPFDNIPIYWKDAVEKYTEDTLLTTGILPWHIATMTYRLTKAFQEEDVYNILRQSAHLSHYIADATVPLHTSKYYNGRVSEQRGIHAFWETRVPELFANSFNFFVGRAEYINNVQKTAWEIVKQTNAQVDTVYMLYDFLIDSMPSHKIYVYDTRGTITKRDYSREFAAEFEHLSNNMIERNMRKAVYYVASYWYTAWVNAGQPDINKFVTKDALKKLKEEEKELETEYNRGLPLGRPNPEDEHLQ